MKEFLIYFIAYLVLAYIFIIMVLRGVYFVFVLKKEPLESLKVIPKIRLKINKGSLLAKFKKEQKQDNMSKWG